MQIKSEPPGIIPDSVPPKPVNHFADLPATLVPKQGISAAISVSASTLKHYRKLYWIEGIHYFYLNPRTIRYNLELVVNWAIHRADSQAHQRAIEAFLHKLESNQQSKKRRRQTSEKG